MAGRATPRLADLLTLSVQTRRDAEATRRALHRRDRGLVADYEDEPTDGPTGDRRRLLAWTRRVQNGQVRQRLHAGWWTALTLGAVAAVFLGVGAALAVFRYDGTRPINVLAVLVVFVALPLVTAAVSALGMLGVLPRLWPGSLPGLGGAVVSAVASKLPGAASETAEALRGELRRGGKVLGRAGVWAGWSVSQVLALMFVGSGWVTFMALLATSDLAFGWASTFEVDPEKLRSGLLSLLWFAPGVVPDAQTVELTISERAVPFTELYQADPDAFKSWWRPLSWLIVAYGIAPRLLLAAWSVLRMRRAVTTAFDRHPAGQDVLRRMKTPLVEAGGPNGDAAQTDAGQTDKPFVDQTDLETLETTETKTSETWSVIRWSAAPTPGVADDAEVRDAGGGCTLEQDQATLHDTAAAGRPVRVYVKGWEPPLAEFTDLLISLRDQLGDGVLTEVAVVRRGETDHAAASVWARKLSAIGDPWLRVVAATEPNRTDAAAEGTP